MNDTYSDGFFYHPDGVTSGDVSRRIALRAVNPRLDDLFAVAVEETKAAIRAIDTRKSRLLARLDEIEAQLTQLDLESAELDVRLSKQHEIIAKYQSGVSLSEDDRSCISPGCQKQSLLEARNDQKKAFEAVEAELPKGWEKVGHRVKDDFLYVTIRKKCPSQTQARVPIRELVHEAMSNFFATEFKRQNWVPMWDRLGSLSPIHPGAG